MPLLYVLFVCTFACLLGSGCGSDGGGGDVVDSCVAASCTDLGASCGLMDDGCGSTLMCGTCEGNDTCGGGGQPLACGRPCVPIAGVFFDLGETLVQENGLGSFATRSGVAEMVANLRANGIRTGVITNTPAGWTEDDLREILIDPDLLDEFEIVLMSSQAGVLKPDVDIYRQAHALLVDPPPIESLAYISETIEELADQETAPTHGARAAGMLGVFLSSGPANSLAEETLAPDDLATLSDADWLACDPRQ